jgi:hypothetical protein
LNGALVRRGREAGETWETAHLIRV